MTDLQTLLERLEEAEGASRELDAELACAFVYRDLRPAQTEDHHGKYLAQPGDIKTPTGFLMADRYTASLDAALGLADRVVPDWAPNVQRRGHPDGNVWWDSGARIGMTTYYSECETPAIAVLCSILRAKIAEGAK